MGSTESLAARWRLEPSSMLDNDLWSSGSIRSVSDLYSPSIFGPTRNFRCECGEYAGEGYVGRSCPSCRTRVSENAARERRTKCGKMRLSVPIFHPLVSPDDRDLYPGRSIMWNLLIPPIGFRLTDERPNLLGTAYEEVFSVNNSIAEKLPEVTSDEVFSRLMVSSEHPELTAIVARLFGSPSDITQADWADPSTLISAILKGIWTLDRDVCTLIRAAGVCINLNARI
jgi:hypothetical protein